MQVALLSYTGFPPFVHSDFPPSFTPPPKVFAFMKSNRNVNHHHIQQVIEVVELTSKRVVFKVFKNRVIFQVISFLIISHQIHYQKFDSIVSLHFNGFLGFLHRARGGGERLTPFVAIENFDSSNGLDM